MHSAPPSPSVVRLSFQGSPQALTLLHDQADHLLPGGVAAFNSRLRALRGHPVVVNEWASWCDPCQSEFPVFQQVSVRWGRRVAFIGVDGKDENGSAAAFLRRFPVSYPSYTDPDQSIGRRLQAVTGYPETLFFNSRGRQQYDHAGPYLTAASLERDIRFYVLR